MCVVDIVPKIIVSQCMYIMSFILEYEAMESYIPQSEDEVGISIGEKVTIVHKSMDGWWKIRYDIKHWSVS